MQFLQNAHQPINPRLIDVDEIFGGDTISDFGVAAVTVHEIDGLKADESKLGLVARPSESLAKRASCSASHLASSGLVFSKAEASRGRSVRRCGPRLPSL